ncbi:MAG: HAMP domain-containing sensor histidine kinase [Actinomycetota bacterium]
MTAAVRSIALVAAVTLAGIAGSIVTALVAGMAGDVAALLWLMVPAVIATVVVAFAAKPLLARASLRQRFVAVAMVAAAVALGNLAVLTVRMSVSDHDATMLIVLLLYSVGAGVASALIVARSSTEAVARLDRTARDLGAGVESARVGTVHGGRELETLARTLDDMADRLGAAKAAERNAESMRRDLITMVSHDLRTPLASLRAMVEAVNDGVIDDPSDLQRYASEMRRSVTQLSTMVDDLFELTQLDAGAIAAETRRVRLDDIVERAIDAVEPTAQEKGLVVVTDLGGAESTPCSPRMIRVLQNLLVNAVRHTPADGTVRLDVHRAGETLALTVADTGAGIEPEDLERVFEPFFRVDPARSGSGAGLGLALAKRIVEALGGEIRAESQPSSGSRFSVAVPVDA